MSINTWCILVEHRVGETTLHVSGLSFEVVSESFPVKPLDPVPTGEKALIGRYTHNQGFLFLSDTIITQNLTLVAANH